MSLLMGLTSLCSADDAQPAWDKTPASKEINGMRRYSLGLVEAISAGMRQSEKQKYPGVHAFLDQSAKALAEIDPEKTPGEWPELDVDQLVTSNPAFWTACYEVAPGDPLMIWLHASYYGINGHVHQVLYTQSLAMRTSANEQVTKEMSRLVISASRVIGLCQQQVDRGIRHHDAKEFPQAEAIYRDVLSICPTHSSALYELGYALRAEGKGVDSGAQLYFDRARKYDPFMLIAYQGSFTAKTWSERENLRSAAIPQWKAFMQTPPQHVKAEQLESLSKALQDSELHELALIARQTLVCRQVGDYNDADRAFIQASLSELLPESDISTTTNLLKVDTPTRLTIKFPAKQN